MTRKFCVKCGAGVTGDSPKFCGQCGNQFGKESSKQTIKNNTGNALNFNGTLNGGVHFVHNPDPNPYKSPPVDWSPTQRRRGKLSVGDSIKFSIALTLGSVVLNTIGFVSSMFTIFGMDIFKLRNVLESAEIVPSWWHNALTPFSIAMFIAGVWFLIFFLVLKHRKELSWFGKVWLNVHGEVYCIHYRCVCPYCGGTMEPKMISSKDTQNQNRVEPKWVCQENSDLHQMNYDVTQISKAWKEGKFKFLFNDLRS